MEFFPEHYFQTATQRMRQARLLFEDGTSYALAIYVGGVAVECLLRALKGRRDPVFDERHDLFMLYKASGMFQSERDRLVDLGKSERQIEEQLIVLEASISEIYGLWANNYRFASEERLRSHLKKITRFQKIKGDYLKEQSRRFLNSAQWFMDVGVLQWRS